MAEDNSIELIHVTKSFGKKSKAVDDLTLKIEDHSFVSILGPSGCGKTTTLRMIAGLETPTSGVIKIGNKVVFDSEKGIDVAPDKRGIGFLFQNYALWPHMTVYENIAFGLKNLKWKKPKIDEKINSLTELLQLDGLLNRYPGELSGGQQQRVAIARTLATDPQILLMDEPLSNLDAKLRLNMRAELKRLHTKTGATFIYVTHDQVEAMSLSTKICLMNTAVLQQYDSPLTVYGKPVNEFVADFVGNPSINLVKLHFDRAENGNYKIYLGNDNFTFIPDETDEEFLGKDVIVGLRPENLIINENDGFDGIVESSFPYGMETTLLLKALGSDIRVVVFGSVDFDPNKKLKVKIGKGKVCLFNPDTKKRITIGSMISNI